MRDNQVLPARSIFSRVHSAKVTQPAGGKAKSSMQGSFLPGKSSIFRTTCLLVLSGPELLCDLASGSFGKSSFLFQRVFARGEVMLAGAKLLLWACIDFFFFKCALSWELLSACSRDEKCVCVSWTWTSGVWEARMMRLWGTGSALCWAP